MKACDELNKSGLRVICVVNTVTRGFYMAKLLDIEISRRFLWKGYFSIDNKNKLYKFAFFGLTDSSFISFIKTRPWNLLLHILGTYLYRWMIVPMQIHFVFSLISIKQGWMKDIIPKILRLMRATIRGNIVYNWRGRFRPSIGVSELILQSF